MHYQTEKNKITNVIESTFKNLSNIIDVNTVIGKPIKTEDGEYVVPISKVTVGVLMGGGEYGKVTIFKKNEDLPYSAGNGAIVSIKPCGFLIKDESSKKTVDTLKVKILSFSDKPYEKLVEKATDFISELNNEKSKS